MYESYFKLLKETEKLLATLQQHELRFTLQRRDNSEISTFSKVHELVNPLIYLSLESQDGEKLCIKFGFEQGGDDYRFSHITAKFLRMLYKCTAIENTAFNIKDYINTDYIIVNCSELYECIEDSKHNLHTFKFIKYKQPATQRKRMLSVA
ncbi:hypothetical protein [Mucilaginibacter sp.]